MVGVMLIWVINIIKNKNNKLEQVNFLWMNKFFFLTFKTLWTRLNAESARKKKKKIVPLAAVPTVIPHLCLHLVAKCKLLPLLETASHS